MCIYVDNIDVCREWLSMAFPSVAYNYAHIPSERLTGVISFDENIPDASTHIPTISLGTKKSELEELITTRCSPSEQHRILNVIVGNFMRLLTTREGVPSIGSLLGYTLWRETTEGYQYWDSIHDRLVYDLH